MVVAHFLLRNRTEVDTTKPLLSRRRAMARTLFGERVIAWTLADPAVGIAIVGARDRAKLHFPE